VLLVLNRGSGERRNRPENLENRDPYMRLYETFREDQIRGYLSKHVTSSEEGGCVVEFVPVHWDISATHPLKSFLRTVQILFHSGQERIVYCCLVNELDEHAERARPAAQPEDSA